MSRHAAGAAWQAECRSRAECQKHKREPFMSLVGTPHISRAEFKAHRVRWKGLYHTLDSRVDRCLSARALLCDIVLRYEALPCLSCLEALRSVVVQSWERGFRWMAHRNEKNRSLSNLSKRGVRSRAAPLSIPRVVPSTGRRTTLWPTIF